MNGVQIVLDSTSAHEDEFISGKVLVQFVKDLSIKQIKLNFKGREKAWHKHNNKACGTHISRFETKLISFEICLLNGKVKVSQQILEFPFRFNLGSLPPSFSWIGAKQGVDIAYRLTATVVIDSIFKSNLKEKIPFTICARSQIPQRTLQVFESTHKIESWCSLSVKRLKSRVFLRSTQFFSGEQIQIKWVADKKVKIKNFGVFLIEHSAIKSTEALNVVCKDQADASNTVDDGKTLTMNMALNIPAHVYSNSGINFKITHHLKFVIDAGILNKITSLIPLCIFRHDSNVSTGYSRDVDPPTYIKALNEYS